MGVIQHIWIAASMTMYAIVKYSCAITNTENSDHPVLFLLLFPTCAWKPVLMALTERLEPHDSQDMKNIRFSFVRSVSGDLHVLQVTYSTVREQ